MFIPSSSQVHPWFTPGSPEFHPRFSPSSPEVDRAQFQLLKQKYVELLSTIAFNLNLRHYVEDIETSYW